MISPDKRLKYIINLYFGNTEDDYVLPAVQAAYLDLARTQRGFGSDIQNVHIQDIRKTWLVNKVHDTLDYQFRDQDDFNSTHKKLMDDLISISQKGFTYGQSQKWINMSLKYCLIIRPESSSMNERYFHAPIDNLLIKILIKNGHSGMPDLGKWSKITDYNKYKEFQDWFRNEFFDEYPISAELRLWKRE